MNFHRTPFLFCLTFAITGAPALAQGVNGRYDYAYGNAEVGGSFAISGSATRTATSDFNNFSYRHSVLGEARTDVRVGAVTREAARVTTSAATTYAGTRNRDRLSSYWVVYYGAGADLNIFIGGQNMLSRSAGAGTFLFGNVTPTSLGASINRGYGVGPFTVTTRNSLDAGASANLEAMLSTSQQRAAAVGNITTYANGRSELAFGIPGVSVGVTSDLRFANVRTDLNLDANPSFRSGRIVWSCNPIRLLLQIFVQAGWSRWVQTIADVNIGAFAGARNLQ